MQQQFELTYNGDTEVLTINPDGWKDNGQRWVRDKKYHGVFQSYTVDTFRFSRMAGGGGDVILNAYEVDDIKAIVTIEVYDYDPQTDDYLLSYTGQLNFDVDQLNIERDFIELGFVSNSNMQKFITRDEIELDIAKLISIDGVTMNAITSAPSDIIFKTINIFRQMLSRGNYGNSSLVISDEDLSVKQINYYATELLTNDVGGEFVTKGPNPEDRTAKIYENTTDEETIINIIEHEILGSSYLQFNCTRNSTTFPARFAINADFRINTYNSEDILIETRVIKDYDIDSGYVTYSNFSVNVILQDEDLQKILAYSYSIPQDGYIDLNIVITPNAAIWAECSSILVTDLNAILGYEELSTGAEDSTVSCYFPAEAFARALQLMTSAENTFYSDFFSRSGSDYYTGVELTGERGHLDAISTAWNIRQFPEKPFTISFSDLFKSFDGIYNLMVGYDLENSRFYIERKENAYRNDIIMFDIGEVDELIIKPYKDAYFNTIQGGVEFDGKYEEFQGTEEFITQFNWSADMPVKETLNIRVPYNLDSVGIELSRRKPYITHASEDTNYDDNIYIVRTDGSETIQGTEGSSTRRGFGDWYNTKLTARECLLRWANFIKCQYWKDDDFTIKFRKSKKTIDIIYINQYGETVSELSDIDASEVADIERLYNPQYYECNGIFDNEKALALKTNPNGLVLFTFNNERYAGFVEEIQTQDYNKQATYRLIAFESTGNIRKIFMDGSQADFMDEDDHLFL